MAGFEAGGGASGGGVAALGPLQALWRDVYRKAGEAAEQRTADLLKYHVYVYHPAAGPATTHTHYYTVQGLWRWSGDPGGSPEPTYVATDSGSILDLETLAVNRTTLEGYPLPGVAGVLRPGDHVAVRSRDDETKFARYTVRAAVELTETVLSIPVNLVVVGDVELEPDEPCYVTFLMGSPPGLAPAGGASVVCLVHDSGDSANELASDEHNPIAFDTADYDPAGFHDDGEPSKITVPPGWAGWFRFSASVGTDLNNEDPEAGPREWNVSLWLNGGGAGGDAFQASGVLPTNITLNVVYATPYYPLEDGDSVELMLWHNGGNTGGVSTGWSDPARLTVERFNAVDPDPAARGDGGALAARVAALEARLAAPAEGADGG